MAPIRTRNLLGAVAQLAADSQTTAIEAATGLSLSAAAALVTIGNAPHESIDFLRQILGRSHSAVVRLVAGLDKDGLILRGQSSDARAVTLSLSKKGMKLVQRILAARDDALQICIDHLDAAEQAVLDTLLAKVLARAVASERQAYAICRLCNGADCDPCPVEDVFA